jgi:type I restriction enzyme M protein
MKPCMSVVDRRPRMEEFGRVSFDQIVDLPMKGDDEERVDAPDRRRLRPATSDNLLFAFKRCHNYIAGNQGLQKPEAFWELLKVIFCKIEDERSVDRLRFFVTNKERKIPAGQLKCKSRLDALFNEVKSKYPTIFRKTI